MRDERTDARHLILEAAVATLAEVGFSATSARAVAQRAGVAPGGVFYHYGSMDELLAATYDWCNVRRIDRLAASLSGPPAEIPAAIAAAARAEFTRPESRALLEIVVGSLGSPELAAHVRRGVDEAVEFTKQAIAVAAAGSPAASVLPVDLVAELAASAFFGLEVLDQVGRRIDLDALATVVELVIALLAQPSSPLPPAS